MLRRTLLTLPLLAAGRLPAADRLEAFGHRWSVPLGADWRVTREDGEETLELITARPKADSPRKPFQYALLEGPPLEKFTIECEIRKQTPRGSLIIVYAWRGPSHFNYVHLSDDTGSEQPVHNGIFHVYGGDRVRISPEQGPCALPTAGWHKVRVVYDAAAGLVETWVDGELNPSLRGSDLSLAAGRVGLGSFFNTGGFRRFRLS
ncbi:MAG TPA: hypothetical protein PLF84_12240 [Bryobacteraceae bacterium]|nr:hypothetical protein [Bryobacterales bacterium]HRJ19813.1 hypothetical protein [Bryobacteraceae bacterium]